MKEILLILIGVAIGYAVAYITFWLMNRHSKWHVVDVPQICRNCHKLYLDGKTQNYIYCPFCGKELHKIKRKGDKPGE